MTMPSRRRKTKPPAAAPAMAATFGWLVGAGVAVVNEDADASVDKVLGVVVASRLLVGVRLGKVVETEFSVFWSLLPRYTNVWSSFSEPAIAAGRELPSEHPSEHRSDLDREPRAYGSAPDEAKGTTRFDQRRDMPICFGIHVVGCQGHPSKNILTWARPAL